MVFRRTQSLAQGGAAISGERFRRVPADGAGHTFFEAIADAMSHRESEAGSAFSQVAAANSAANSGRVMSAFSATFFKRNARCGSSLAWRRPPLGLGARLPRTSKAFTRLTTQETDTLKCAAAAWRE